MDARALEELVAAFRARTLPHAQWTHAAHLAVGAYSVHHLGAEAALARLRDEIRRLNEAHGTLSSATSGYHETITAAFVRLLDEGLAAFAPEVPLERRIAALLAGPLGGSRVLLAVLVEGGLDVGAGARRVGAARPRAAVSGTRRRRRRRDRSRRSCTRGAAPSAALTGPRRSRSRR